MSGLFGTLNIGKSGMFASQGAVNTTSHNISNSATPGYSRQRVELQTSRPYCKPSMNSTAGPGQVGTGVETVAINRVRDSFLDYQVRVEFGIQGDATGRVKYLSQIENIFNEPSDTSISKLMSKFFDSWQDLSNMSETSNAKTVVVQQSKALADELRHTSGELDKLEKNVEMQIQEATVQVNGMLDQLDSVNREIAQVKVAGQQPNDLMDRRDLLLDKLSEKLGFEVEREQFEGIKVKMAGIPNVKVNGKPEDGTVVRRINPDDVARLAFVKMKEETDSTGKPNGKFTIMYYENGDTTKPGKKFNGQIDSTKLTKDDERKRFEKLKKGGLIWTDKNGNAIKSDGDTTSNMNEAVIFDTTTGEISGYRKVQGDIANYKQQLDKLAKGLAYSVNAIYSQNDTGNQDDTQLFFVNKDEIKAPKDNKISAENIIVSENLKKDPTQINTKSKTTAGEGDGKRALAIAQLRDTLLAIQNIDNSTTRDSFIKTVNAHFVKNDILGEINTFTKNVDGMTSENFFKGFVGELGINSQTAKRVVKNQKTLLKSFEEARQSVSGVGLDEEFANLVQFNRCFQANAKVISTVDQLLDVVVNGLKR